MFCPNCGNECGNANFCPNCGTNLKGAVITASTVEDKLDERTEMIRRYEKYMPNRLAAIKALRTDTGMGLAEAKQVIDELFDGESATYQPVMSKAQKKAELKKSGQVYCPKCLSTSVSANQKGFGLVRGALGAMVGLDVGMIAGSVGSKKIICTCLKCGYQWKAGKK